MKSTKILSKHFKRTANANFVFVKSLCRYISEIAPDNNISSSLFSEKSKLNKKIQPLSSSNYIKSDIDYSLPFLKYASSTSNEGDQISLSPEVLQSMIGATLDRHDRETLKLIISEAACAGYLTSVILETSIKQCLDSSIRNNRKSFSSSKLENEGKINDNDDHYLSCLSSAVYLLNHSISNNTNIKLNQTICQRLLEELVSNGFWNDSYTMASYMILQGHEFKDREIFFIVGGLMKNSDGVTKVFELITLINKYSRDDIAGLFSYTKANRYALSMTSHHSYRKDINSDVIERTMKSSVESFKNGWFSFSLSKLIVALSCGAGKHDLADVYIRNIVEIVNNKNEKSENNGDKHIDLLSVLRGFSQGAGIACKDSLNYKGNFTMESPVSRTILKLSIENLNKLGMNEGPLQSMDLFKMYWVLNYRIRFMPSTSSSILSQSTSASSSSSSEVTSIMEQTFKFLHEPAVSIKNDVNVPLEQDEFYGTRDDYFQSNAREQSSDKNDEIDGNILLIDSITKQCYNDLINFIKDSSRTSSTFKPAKGKSRRLFRILCDELGLQHKVSNKTNLENEQEIIIKVWKSTNTMMDPPSLEEVIRRDCQRPENNRKFDGEQANWNLIASHLMSLSDRTISNVCMNVTQGMSKGYASPAWSLDWLKLLQDCNIMIPRGLLRNILVMCEARGDLYGVMEVLYAAKDESNEVKKGRKNQKKIFFDVDSNQNEDESLRQQDWNKACNIAWRSRILDYPPSSFRSSFTEIMSLMQEYGVELEPSTIRTLLRFLVFTQPKSDITWKILRRLYRDKSMEICHIECVAITSLVLRRLPPNAANYEAFSLSKPMYRSPHYLTVFPDGTNQLLDLIIRQSDVLGMKFLKPFESAWKNLHSSYGRKSLYDLLLNLVSVSGSRQELIELISSQNTDITDIRSSISLLATYSAYLIGAYDNDYRSAFNLLFAVESLCQEAEIYAESINEDNNEINNHIYDNNSISSNSNNKW